jgi:hypothetical protein
METPAVKQLSEFLAAFAALSTDHLSSLVALAGIAIAALAICAVVLLARDRRGRR